MAPMESMVAKRRSCRGNKVGIGLAQWLGRLPEQITAVFSVEDLYSSFPKSYTVYEPMLLLPPNAFKSPPWQKLLPNLDQECLRDLYSSLLSSQKLTHLAINAPIPLQQNVPCDSRIKENIRRIPSNIQPLHGDFGTAQSVSPSNPTGDDFASAFWVSALQNGISQVWAPLHTMFSRGNITEKTRLLTLPSVTETVKRKKETGKKCAAVDLYAGIGYFAFSYIKAGISVCLCWEISEWSVEGLQRGARANGWRTRLMSLEKKEAEIDIDGVEQDIEKNQTRILIFPESNEFAVERIQDLRLQIPPIRHVNCGLLPSSRNSWPLALEALDPAEGGWLHLHENIAVSDIKKKAEEILEEIQTLANGMLDRKHLFRFSKEPQTPELQRIEQVKTFAPGVMHCVLDIHVPPALG